MVAKKSKISRSHNPDQLGRTGENLFGVFLDRAKLIANTSSRADRMGWDYIVEVPFDAARGTEPFDKRQKAPDIKIQVKTIWSNNTDVKVELIAAERLARWHYPSIIAILRLNEDLQCHDLYLIHLIDENLSRVLEALRKAEGEGTKSIKNKKINFSVDRGIKIDPEGMNLAHELKVLLGEDATSYSQRKKFQLDNLGYGIHPIEGNFILATTEVDEALDVFLGLKRAEVISFEANDVRFGISIPLVRVQSGNIQITPNNPVSCDVIIEDCHGNRRASFIAKANFAQIQNGLIQKAHISSNLLEISLLNSPNRSEGSIDIGMDQSPFTLDNALQVINSHIIMTSDRSVGKIRFKGKNILTFELPRQKGNLDLKNLEFRYELFSTFRDSLKRFNIDMTTFTNECFHNNINTIHFISEVMKNNSDSFFTVGVDITTEELELNVPRDAMIASAIWLRENVIAFWIKTKAIIMKNEESATLKCSNFVLKDMSLVDGYDEFDKWVRDVYEESGIDVLLRTDRMFEMNNASQEPDNPILIGC